MTVSNEPAGVDHDVGSLRAKAWQDLIGGLRKTELWGRIGWLDVKRRYRRTVIGPFWSSGTLAIYTIAVGVVGAGLFKQDVHEYLPYLSSGMIVWTLISTIILESCTLFVTGHALLRNVQFEYSILAYALVWRNFVVFLHNLFVFAVIALVSRPEIFGPTDAVGHSRIAPVNYKRRLGCMACPDRLPRTAISSRWFKHFCRFGC